MERRDKSEAMETLAAEVIDEIPELSYIRDLRVVYLESDLAKKSKGRTVFGECEKIPDKYKWAIEADFTITFYVENISGLSAAAQKILMEHELRHIGEVNGKIYVRPHDIEDFALILSRYGLNWEKRE